MTGLFLAVFLSASCGSQIQTKVSQGSADEFLDFSASAQIPSNWVKKETDLVEFYIPASMKGGKWQGDDSSGMTFTDERLSLDLEEGPYAFNFDFIVGTKRTATMNGKPATVFYGDRNLPYPGRAVNADGSSKTEFFEKNLILGLRFDEHPSTAAFMVSAKSHEDLKIAKIVLHSIKIR